MRKRRSQLDIIIEILRIGRSASGAPSEADLSYAETQRCLKLLHEAGYIEMADRAGRHSYAVTAKGAAFLKILEAMTDLIEGTPEAKNRGASVNLARGA